VRHKAEIKAKSINIPQVLWCPSDGAMKKFSQQVRVGTFMKHEKRTLLLFENSIHHRRIREYFLRKEGRRFFSIIYAKNPEEGLNVLEQDHVDAVLMYLNPCFDLRKNPVLTISQVKKAPPIIVFFPHNRTELSRNAVASGAQDVILMGELPHVDLHFKIECAIERHRILCDLKKAREEASKANEAKSDFLAMMSHEIRTPLNGILGISRILLDRLLHTEDRNYVKLIRQSGENLLYILNDILDFSRIEAGKMQLELIDFKPKDLVEDLSKTQMTVYSDKNIQFVLEHDLQDTFYCGDPGRLRQVLLNLIHNAYKFSQQGRIWLRVIKKDSSTANSEILHFEIQDEGIGIPPEALHRIFTAFTQAETSISRRFGGSGLGLSICKKLVQLMGGTIGVQSTVGKGATFWFEIPLAYSKRSGEVSTGLTAVVPDNFPFRIDLSDKQKRILVVDDQHLNQMITTKFLEKMGYQVDSVGSGEEALAALRELPYDLILMDCQMPELDGYETTRIIRNSKTIPNHHLPIVAITANVLSGERERCLEAGMTDYLSKPVDFMRMSQVIEECLHHHRDQSAQSKSASTQPIGSLMTPEGAVLDPDRLAQIKTLDIPGSVPFIVEMGGEFLEELENNLVLIAQHLHARDEQTIRFVAHQMVSHCGNFAALRLAHLLRCLETLEAPFFWERCFSIFESIKIESKRVRQALTTEIKKAS